MKKVEPNHTDGRVLKVFKSGGFWFGLAVFLLAVSVRGVYLYQSSDNPTFRAPVVDSLTYDQIARRVVEGEGITDNLFWQPLFYPLFLSVVYWLSNSSILCVKIVQALLGVLTCVLVYRLGSRIFGRDTGTLAGALTAVYMPLVFFEGELLAVGWAAFWSVATVLALLKAADKPKAWSCFVLGLCGALSIATRPVFLLFIAAGCVWLVVVWIRGRVGVKKLLLALLGVAAGLGVVAGPVAILSYRVAGRVTILPYSGGINFYVGNNPNYKETITIRPGLQWRELTELPMKYGIRDKYETERFFFNETIDYIISRPAGFLKGLGYKAGQFLNSREMPRNVDIYLFRKWSGLLRAGVWKAGGFGFPFGVLLPLAVLGGVYCRRMVPGPIWLFMIFYPMSVILVFVTSRYRVPIMPVIIVLAAWGCGAVWKILQARQWRRLAVTAAVVLGVGLASSVAGPFYAEQLDYEPELYYGLGDSLDKQGRADEAVEAYSKAVSLRDDYVDAYYNLGLLLVGQGRVEEAISHYRQTLYIKPDYTEAHNNLGLALQSQGKLDDAISHYRQALLIKPGHAKAHYNLGIALQSQGKLDEAVSHYRQALRLKPDYAEAHNNLGIALAMQGKLDGAVSHFHQALHIKPDYLGAHRNLGNTLLQQGKLKEAITCLTDALRFKADWVEMLNNLAWLLATCSDQKLRDAGRAIELAERASKLTGGQNAEILDTLAAAYASAGRFEQAITTAQAALALASAVGDDELANRLRERLELYRQEKH